MEMLIVLVVGVGVCALIFGVVHFLDQQSGAQPPTVSPSAPSPPELTLNILPWNGVVLATDDDALCVVLPWLDLRLSSDPIEGEVEFSDILLVDHVGGEHDIERLAETYPDAEIHRTTDIEAAELGAIDWERTETGIEVMNNDRRIAIGADVSIFRLVEKPFVNVLIGGFKPELGPELFEAPDAMQALAQIEGLINFSAVPPASAEFVSIIFDAVGIPVMTVPPTVGPPFLDQRVFLATLKDAQLEDPAVTEAAVRYLTIHEQLAEASVLLERGIEQFPDAGILYYHRGMLALLNDDTEAAIHAFNKATVADVPFLEAYNSIAACHAVAGDYDKAQAALDAISSDLPDDQLVLQNRVRLLFLKGETEAAEAVLEEHNDSLSPLVDAALRNGEAPTRHIYPHHAKIAVSWAKLSDKLGQFDDSERLFKRALDLNPNDIEAIADYGVSLSEQGRDDDAVAWYLDKIDSVLGGVLLNYNLGNALRRIDQHTDAKAAYEKALDAFPGWPEARVAMTTVCCDLGEKEEARKHARELDPNETDPELLDALDEMIEQAT